MEIIDRKQAFREGKTRFYTGVPCKNGHDSERYTSMGGCVECINTAKKPWAVNEMLRGSPLPQGSPWAHQFLVEVPHTSTQEQRAGFAHWVQHVAVNHYFAQFGLSLGPVKSTP